MFTDGLPSFHLDRILVRMEQLDRAATHNILLAMSVAGVDRYQLADATGIHEKTLLRRMTDGSWKLIEIGRIAHALGCRTSELVPSEGGAAA